MTYERPPLHVFTIALDAMPWLACIFSELMRVRDVRWSWTIVEGAAMPVGDTKWIARQEPRLSGDGTTQFLDAIAHHPRVRVIRRERWEGKTPMCQAATDTFREPGILMQQDGDEIWSADQYVRIGEFFEDLPDLMTMRFHCDYMVGPNIRTTDRGHPDEWLRAWRFTPGMQWISHEPPNLAGNVGRTMRRDETARHALVFQHFSWALPKHVAQKEQLYGPSYRGAMAGWTRLQTHPRFPVSLKSFFPWSAATTMVDRVFKESHAPTETRDQKARSAPLHHNPHPMDNSVLSKAPGKAVQRPR